MMTSPPGFNIDRRGDHYVILVLDGIEITAPVDWRAERDKWAPERLALSILINEVLRLRGE